MAKAPRLLKINAEMQRWCTLLAEELSGWPDVSSRPMFGMTAFYRGQSIFAALPKTRAPETPFSLLIKLRDARHAALRSGHGPGADWRTFSMTSEADVSKALKWLGRAYERAPSGRKARS